MERIPLETLCKIVKVVFEHYHPKNETSNVEDEKKALQREGLDEILRFFDLEERLEKGYLIYQTTVDEKYKLPLKMVQQMKFNPYQYTYYHLSDYDLTYLEDLINDKYESVASSYYPLFDVLGYVLTDVDGRWRLLEAYKDNDPMNFLNDFEEDDLL